MGKSKSRFSKLFQEYVFPEIEKQKKTMGDLSEFGVFHINLLPQKRQVFLSEFDNFLLLKPIVEYDDDIQALILNDEPFITKEEDKIIVKQRDLEYEKAFAKIIRALHPNFEKQFPDEYFYLPIKEVLKGNWFFEAFEQLIAQNIEIFGLKELERIKLSPYKGKFSIGISSGEDWFDVNVEVTFGDEKVKLAALRKAILNKEKYIKLSDGRLGFLPQEWVEKLSKYFRAGSVTHDQIKISKLKFHVIDELIKEINLPKIMEEIAEKKERLKAFKSMKKIRVPKELNGVLRDYQKEGLKWLNFLDEFQWGGILADDMGLGKTIQILAFLQLQKKKSKKANLVVVPTSLLFNWENEIQKFLPSLKYVIHHGQGRKTEYTDFKNFDLIITTYGVMAIDIEMFRKYKFNYIILDESQAIKNIGSLRYKAALLLRGRNRLTMTGTPIENNTFDLYAQMNFVNPGFLGSHKDFKEAYSNPIDKERNSDRAAELQRLINPFLMRRTKEQVATELPPKIEDVLICTMGDEQRKIYDAFKNKYRNYLLGKIEEVGIGKSKIYVLEGLMKLRQICDSPRLLNEEVTYTSESIKIKILMEHIREKNDHHKILIFSQFVSMLSLIRKELERHDILYEYLDGKSTKKQREASVNRFQDDDKYRVFLISLKAGGTGLNLTAADYVYIVDPWWNPAVETQAIDRAHRIGQDKHVIAYRMICKNTIEEKIVNLQKKKTQIASELIKTEDTFMKKITTDDIKSLFE